MNNTLIPFWWFVAGVCAALLGLGLGLGLGPFDGIDKLPLLGALLGSWGLIMGLSASPSWRFVRPRIAGLSAATLAAYAAGSAIHDPKTAAIVALVAVAFLALGLAQPNDDQPLTGATRVSQYAPLLTPLWLTHSALLGLLALARLATSPVGLSLWTELGLVAPGALTNLPSQLPLLHDLDLAEALALGALAVLAWLAAWVQTEASWPRFALAFGLILPILGLTIAQLEGDLISQILSALLVVLGLCNWGFILAPRWGERMIEGIRARKSVLFFVQALLFAGGACVWWFRPGPTLMSLGEIPKVCHDILIPQVTFGIGVTRAIGPVAAGFVILAWLGARANDGERRNLIAWGVWLWLSVWLAVFVFNVSGHFGQGDPRIHPLSISIGLILFLAWLTLTPLTAFQAPRAAQMLPGGASNTKPASLWWVWTLQGLVLLGLGLGCLFFAETLARYAIAPTYRPSASELQELYGLLSHDLLGSTPESACAQWIELGRPEQGFTVSSPSPYLPFVFEVDQLRISSSYFIGMGAVSLGANRLSQTWAWRSILGAFVAWQLALILTWLFSYSDWLFSWWFVGLVATFVVFAVWQLAILRRAPVPDDLGCTDLPGGLIATDELSMLPMATQTLTTRRRASHLFGVGATGWFTVKTDAEVPTNAWLARICGQETIPVTVRFANLSFEDDACLDVRGVAFSIEPEDDEPFELVLNTGSFTAPRNVVEFAAIVISKWLPTALVRRKMLADARAREGAIAGLRRAPSSYLKLVYHSQIVRLWLSGAPENAPRDSPLIHTQDPGQREPWLVRYRLVPEQAMTADGVAEDGLPDDADCAAPWQRQRRSSELRPRGYLRQELREHLRAQPAKLTLQAQFRSLPREHDQLPGSWYDASLDWDEREFPWLTIGVITLRDTLSHAETERLRFNPGRCPSSMGTPRATGLLDERSLGDSELRVMAALSELRTKIQRLTGIPADTKGQPRK